MTQATPSTDWIKNDLKAQKKRIEELEKRVKDLETFSAEDHPSKSS